MLRNKVYIISIFILFSLLVTNLGYTDTIDYVVKGPFWFTLSSYVVLLITAGISSYAIMQTRTVDIWKKHSEALKVQLDYLEKRVSTLAEENSKLKSEMVRLQAKTDISVVLDRLEEHSKESLRLFNHLSDILNTIALTLNKMEKKG